MPGPVVCVCAASSSTFSAPSSASSNPDAEQPHPEGKKVEAHQQQECFQVLPPILPCPMYYLSLEQREPLLKLGLLSLIPQLPCWAPHHFISRALYGEEGLRHLTNVVRTHGNFVWAHEFQNTRTAFCFREPAITVDTDEEDQPHIPDLDHHVTKRPKVVIGSGVGDDNARGTHHTRKPRTYSGGVEHYYQLMKSRGTPQHVAACARMEGIRSAWDAMQLGCAFPLRPDWEQVKRKVMKTAMEAKFHLRGREGSAQMDLVTLLLATQGHVLAQVKPNDEEWGSGEEGKGSNLHAVIAMEVRQALLQEQTSPRSSPRGG